MVKKIKPVKLDMTNVKDSSGINPKQMPEGDYRGKVINVDDTPAQDGTAMWRFDVQLADHASAVYPFYCKLQENQLWKLRNLLLAAGFKAPKSQMTVDPNRLVGKEIGITLEDDEYEGKMKSVIAAVIPVSELETTVAQEDDDETDDEDEVDETEVDDEEVSEDDEDDEAPEDDEEEDEEESEEGDEFDEMDRAALKKALKAAGLPGAKKSESDDDLRDRLRIDADEDEEEDVDDEMDVEL